MGKVRLSTKMLGAAFVALMTTTAVSAVAEKGEVVLPKPQTFIGKVVTHWLNPNQSFPSP